MNKIIWANKPCGVGNHDDVLGQGFARCKKCMSVRRITLGDDYGRASHRQKYYKFAVDKLGTSYLVECDQYDNERIR